MQALERWERALDEILAGRRRRLTGAEYITLVDEIDRAGDARAVRAVALRLAEKLGRVDGAAGEARFSDSGMTRAYQAAKRGTLQDVNAGAEAAPQSVAPLPGRPAASDSRRDLRPRPPL